MTRDHDGSGPSERHAHQARVAELCRCAARSLKLEDLTANALVLAAQLHRDSPVAAPESTEIQEPAESLVMQRAQFILQGHHPTPELDCAIQVFSACDALDEAIEFSLYEGSSVTAAIAEFNEDCASSFDPLIVEAMGQITTPRYRPSLETGVPVFPRAAARLMQTSAETTSAYELESIVATDPVFTALLLGASNSALLGGRMEIRQIGQAILRVGVPFARKILLAACVGQLFSSGALAKLWKHSRTVGAIAHELAAECAYDQEGAYAAGLLHDIGRLVTRRAPPQVRDEEAAMLAAGFPLTYVETLLYGCDHATVGADLLEKWKLPQEMADAVRFHHRPECAGSSLAGILYLAEEESVENSFCSESLSPGLRRACATQISGITALPEGGINRKAAIFALAS